MSKVLSGVKPVDAKIIDLLSDYELGQVCLANKYVNEICKDDNFWMNRTIRVFGPILGSIEELRTYKENRTWKEFYQYLAKLTNHKMERWLQMDIFDVKLIKELTDFTSDLNSYENEKMRKITYKIAGYFMQKFIRTLVKDVRRQDEILEGISEEGLVSIKDLIQWTNRGTFTANYFTEAERKFLQKISFYGIHFNTPMMTKIFYANMD